MDGVSIQHLPDSSGNGNSRNGVSCVFLRSFVLAFFLKLLHEGSSEGRGAALIPIL